MATIVTGDGYEIDDFCENLREECKAWNVATAINGGAASAFGATGQRIYSEPPDNQKVGRDQPIIFVQATGMSGNIYGAKEKATGSGGYFIYDAKLSATVVIMERGTKVYNAKRMRDWASRLRRWLEQKGANGFCQAFAVGDTVPVSYESVKAPDGVITWQIPVEGVREVTRTIYF